MQQTEVKKRRPKIEGEGARKVKRIVLIVLAAALVIAAAVVFFLLQRFSLNRDYLAFLPEAYTVEEGSAFSPIPEESGDVPGFQLAAENDLLKLYTKPATAEVAVYDRRSGVTVYSNPQEADSDPVANSTNKDWLRSQFILEYLNASMTSGTYDSYSMSVALGQAEAFSIPGGVRYVYDVGKHMEIRFYVPSVMSAERMDSLKAAMAEDADGLALVEQHYTLDEADGLYHRSTQASNNARIQNRIHNVVTAAGFTLEDYFEMEALAGGESAETLTFRIALDYTLDGDSLKVEVPVSEIEERGGGLLQRVQLLRYMGAASAAETGDLVVPNGSGALIHFNNGKTNSAVYSQYVYDMDLVDADYNKTQNTEPVRMALFGICRADSTVLATIERGASLATINADVSGRYNNYNYAYPAFVLRGASRLTMFGTGGADGDTTIAEKALYNEQLTVRYTLLDRDHAGYSGIAAAVREKWLAQGILQRKEASGDIPFYYDVIGGVKETAHFLGVQRLRVLPMTTFEQAEEIATRLNTLGVKNQVMTYRGWMNGGYFHDATASVRVLRQLGGVKGLNALAQSMERRGGSFYGDVAFQKVTEISRNYWSSQETSRYYAAGYTVELGVTDPSTLRRTSSLGYAERWYYLLSPKFLNRYVDGFKSGLKDVADTVGIALRDLGDELHSDKRRTEIISREQALSVVRAQLASLESTGRGIQLSGGNDYAISRGVEHVVDAPMAATSFFIIDESIPLYQMILHGSVDYAGGYMNLKDSASARQDVLRLIEYGASCRWVFTWRDAADMKYTGLNNIYAATFSAWAEEAADTWRTVNEALSQVSGAVMLRHERLAEDLVKVTYDNGVALYVNYAAEPQTADGLTIPAEGWLTEGGEGA